MLKREQQEDTSRWQLGKYVKLRATCMSSSHLNEVSGLSVQDTLLPIKRKFPCFTVSWKKKLYTRDSMSIRLEIVMVITTVMMKNEDGSALEFMIM